MAIRPSRMFNASRFVLAAAVLGVLLLAAAGMAQAEERITFKNGRSLVVKAIREEGTMLFVTLVQGGEVGFPKSLIENFTKAESGPVGPINHNYAGRGKTFMELAERKMATSGMNPNQTIQLQGSTARDESGRAATVGFSYKGSKEVGSVPQEPMGQGMNIRDYFQQRRAAAQGKKIPGQPLPGTAPLRTFDPPKK